MKPFSSSARTNQVDIFGDTTYDKYSVGFGIIDMSSRPTDYRIDSTGLPQENLPKYLTIIPETTGVIFVELAGMDEGAIYKIQAAQITAHQGLPLKYKVRKVLKSSTTATFSVVW